ncbi:MAG: peptidoglycan-binding protein [Candidatus Yanofskybacteria bacterium]|nr:peptidoglycan-binding protein [Candidatus Yanofskybacteria bacterium]
MKKVYFLFAILVTLAIFHFRISVTNASKPSDFGLKEGDLISAIFSDDPDVYIINEHGFKRLFLNPEIFKFYAHLGGFTNVKLITPEIRDSFPTVGLFRNCEQNDPKVYGFESEDEDEGKIRWVNTSGEEAINDDPDFFKKVFCINSKEFKWYKRGEELKSVKEVSQYHRATPAIPAIPATPAIPASPSQPLVSPTATPTPASVSFTPTPTPASVTQSAQPATPATPAQPASSTSTPTPTPTLTASPTPTQTLTASPTPSVTASSSATPTPTPTPIPGSRPNPPTNLSATAKSSSRIDLSWSASSNAIETGVQRYDVFRLYYRPDGGQVGRSYIANVSASPYSSMYSYSDTNLTANTNYIYNVTAVAAYWNSELSASANATTFGATPTPTPTPVPISPTSTCVGGDDRVPGLPICLMPENLSGTSWNEVDNATGKVISGAVCSVDVCGRNGEWRTWPSNQLLNGRYYSNGYPENSTYIQTPFNSAYGGQYYTNGVWQTGSGGIVQPGSSQISNLNTVPKIQSNFSRNLAIGSTGNDVKLLQALLVNEVSYSADLITGYFGRITRDAVKRLQAKYGVKPVSGYFGEITRRTLRALLSN